MNSKAWALMMVGIAGSVLGAEAPARSGLTETCKALRSLPVTEEYSYGAVPAEAKPLLKDLKAELREIIESIVKSASPGPDTSTQVHKRIVSALKARDVVVGAEPDGDNELGYGYVAEISATAPPQQPDLLAVTVTISIPCGNDTSLYVFRHSAKGWNPVLVDEVTTYTDISGAQGYFKFLVSPPAADGSFVVLSATVPPWCTSVWHPLRYRLQKIAPGDAPPTMLLSAEVELIAEVAGYEVQPRQGGFAIIYSVWNEDNTDWVRETLELTLHNGKVNSRRSRGG